MKRKIVKHGSATLTISLPSKWAKKYGIKPGDSLDIEEAEGALLIKCPTFRESVKEAYIDLSEFNKIGKRSLRALFKGGCDTIRIKYNQPETFSKIILPTLNQFIGFEIMKQDTGSCLVKEISGLTENTELDGLIRRMLHILKCLASDCAQAAKSNHTELLKDIAQRDVNVNRAANFIRRLLNKRGTTRIRELPVVYYTVEQLENLGDEYKHLCRYILEMEYNTVSDDVVHLLDEASKAIGEFSTLYFKFSVKIAHDLSMWHNAMQKKIKSLNPKAIEEVIIINHLANMVRLVNNLLGPLLTLRLPDLCIQDV
ncbi:MAG: AbrB/MazE/SpoVT family DNA-binding domain-containing protein [Candidatus Nanoarchaeia archaeon]